MDAVLKKSRVKSHVMLSQPIVEAKKKSFKDAVAECNGTTVDAFFDELNARIEKWPDHA